MLSDDRWGKIDFHLHSYASNSTDYYAANAFSIPESYSDPFEVRALLVARGMTLFTLTDHNSIDGAKALLDKGLPGVFLSSEMTATFPEDGCNVHVTVANVTEAEFAEVNRLRGNIYEMIAYCDERIATERERGASNRLVYFMTHPLMSTQNRPYGREGSLSLEHLEKMLLLSNAFEVRNGARTRALNELTERWIRSIDRATIELLADKHGLEPKGEAPWKKSLLAGSDDHSGINPGRTWTSFPYAGARPTPNELIVAVRERRTLPAGAHGGPITLAHSILKLLYDGTTPRRARALAATKGTAAPATKGVTLDGPVSSVLRLLFDPESQGRAERLLAEARFKAHVIIESLFPRRRTPGEGFEAVFGSEVYSLLGDASFRRTLDAIEPSRADDRIFLVVGTLLNRVFARYVENLRNAGDPNVVMLVKEIVALVTSNLFVSLPYLMAFLAQSTDSLVSRDVKRRFGLVEAPKVALLTDTFFEINGVSASIKRMIREAIRRDLGFTVVTCLGPDERATHLADPEIRAWIDAGRLKIIESVARLDLPEYDRLQIRFPPLLDLLRYLQDGGFTKVQISTPGIIGVSGLVAAKMLQLETAATYHTSVPEYVENYTRDISLEALAWKYMLAFYHAVDEVLVPSRFIARHLHKRGLRNKKLLVLDRWVDTERFHPRFRAPGFYARWGVAEDAIKIAYVGRLGVEKNLALVAEAFKRLASERRDVHLVLIGDGPFRGELEAMLAGTPSTFTGFLERDELARAIASADVKVFPSTTDTWGNAPLEAQSSGVPVIVSRIGGPAELVIEDVTGLIVGGHDASELASAMRRLLDPATRARMGRAAREFAEAHRVDEPFTAVFDADAYRRRARSERALDLGRAGDGGPPTVYGAIDASAEVLS